MLIILSDETGGSGTAVRLRRRITRWSANPSVAGTGMMLVMMWTAPQVTRVHPPRVADERPMLEGWLDFHRATLLWKCARLDGGQLAQRAAPPSSMSLLGLVRHMTDVERSWFRRRLHGEEIDPLY